MLGLQRAAKTRLLLLLALLAIEAIVLRFLRWQAIEDAKPFDSFDLSLLASHRELVKAILFITVAMALLLFRELGNSGARERLAGHRATTESVGVNLLAFFLLAALIWSIPTAVVDNWLAASLWGVPALYTLLTLAWVAVVASATALLVPLDWVAQVLRQNLLGAFIVLVGTLLYVLSQSYLTEFESVWSAALLPPTVYVATQFSALIGIGAVAKPGTTYFGTESFVVDIGPTCLGYQGVSIVLVLLLTYILTSSRHLRTSRALLVLPAAVAAMLLFNALRISVLVAIGAVWSPEIAVMGFHSTAGWVELILTLVISVLVLNRYTFFLKGSTRVVGNERSENARPGHLEILLLPQVVLIGVSFITQMFTGEFYWLYPVHIAAAAYAFWHYRSFFPKAELGAPLVATVAGLAVFAIWISLIPPDLEKASTFASNLFSASPALIAAWLMLRFLGTSLVVPLVEELAFRGFLLREIQRLTAKAVPGYAALMIGLAVSSIVFGILHSAWLAGSIAGLIYGAVYLYRGKLYDAVLAHAVTNLLLALYAMTFERWSYL